MVPATLLKKRVRQRRRSGVFITHLENSTYSGVFIDFHVSFATFIIPFERGLVRRI